MTVLAAGDREILQTLAVAGGAVEVPTSETLMTYANVVTAGYVFALIRLKVTRYQLTRLGWSMIELSHG